MLGAHHDTVYNGPGAIDNTVGTVTIIELARQLASHKPKRTIRLATWGGEEEGLFGSTMWFEAHEGDALEATARPRGREVLLRRGALRDPGRRPRLRSGIASGPVRGRKPAEVENMTFVGLPNQGLRGIKVEKQFTGEKFYGKDTDCRRRT